MSTTRAISTYLEQARLAYLVRLGLWDGKDFNHLGSDRRRYPHRLPCAGAALAEDAPGDARRAHRQQEPDLRIPPDR